MFKNRTFITVLMALLILCLSVGFTACGKDKGGDKDGAKKDKEKATTEEVIYTNEEGKTQEELNSDAENFLGTWTADSPHAEYLYGTIEITMNEDGTFDADVTDEQFSGTWEKVDDGVEFDSVLLSGKFYFGKKCRMVIYEDGVDPIVLKRK